MLLPHSKTRSLLHPTSWQHCLFLLPLPVPAGPPLRPPAHIHFSLVCASQMPCLCLPNVNLPLPPNKYFPSFKACPKSQSSKKFSLISPCTLILSSASSEVFSHVDRELPVKLSSDWTQQIPANLSNRPTVTKRVLYPQTGGTKAKTGLLPQTGLAQNLLCTSVSTEPAKSRQHSPLFCDSGIPRTQEGTLALLVRAPPPETSAFLLGL